MVEVESWSEAEAIELAHQKIENNPNDYFQSTSTNLTSIYINDKESKGFAPFVADYKQNEDLEYFL
jgi:hypothetical protein